MLDAIKRYMADNPLRAIMRRNLPALLERRLHLRVAGRDYAAFGCLFLLKRAEKEQVFYHRKDSTTGLPTEQTADFAASRDRQLAEGRQGVVLVSPAVSIPERIVINAAIDEAVADAKRLGIHGKETTPYLLARIKDLTGGDSLASNIQLVLNNARLAARVAKEMR
jgi:pseudouridine-5'-phosphate glycosidase